MICLLSLPVLLIHLGTGDPVDMMELFNLIPVREAMRDHHWLMPTLNGMPRLEKPPLPAWIPAALGTLLHSESLWVLRLPSIVMAILTSVATYGIGCTVLRNNSESAGETRKAAAVAAVLLLALIRFNREARLASYDIYATAFLTCAAFFLIKLAELQTPTGDAAPFVPQDSKAKNRLSLLFALAGGVATGLSILSKGPVPAATVMLPLGLWLLIYHRRPALFAYVAVAAVASIATFMPWLIAIAGIPHLIAAAYPDAWKTWSSELLQFGTGNAAAITAGTKAQLTDPKWYYVQIFSWVAPLTPTFIAGLLLPFLRSEGLPQPAPAERRGRMLLWLILVMGLVMLTAPSEKKPRYALQLFPYAALLCAAVWQEFLRLPAVKKIDMPAQVLLAAQALFFIVPGLAILLTAGIVAVTGSFPHWPGVADLVRAPGLLLAGLLGAVVLMAGVILWQRSQRREFGRAIAALAIASVLFTFALQTLYKSEPQTHTNPARQPVEAALAPLEPDMTVYTFAEARPWLSTLYFGNRILPAVYPEQFIQRLNDNAGAPFYLMIITGFSGGSDVPPFDAPAALRKIEAATGRIARPQATWQDENRITTLFGFSPAAPASARSISPDTATRP